MGWGLERLCANRDMSSSSDLGSGIWDLTRNPSPGRGVRSGDGWAELVLRDSGLGEAGVTSREARLGWGWTAVRATQGPLRLCGPVSGVQDSGFGGGTVSGSLVPAFPSVTTGEPRADVGPQGTPLPRPRLYPYGLCGCFGCWPEGGKQQKGWKEHDPLSCLCPSSFLFRSCIGSAPVRTHIAGRRGSVGSGPGDVCNSVIVNPDPQVPPEVSHLVPPIRACTRAHTRPSTLMCSVFTASQCSHAQCFQTCAYMCTCSHIALLIHPRTQAYLTALTVLQPAQVSATVLPSWQCVCV